MVSGHDIAMALRAAYWAMHREADAVLARHGVTADQFVLMSLLAEVEAIKQQELVRRATSDANTVRAMLVLLEGRGLVSREAHPTDGRARSVALTGKGRRMHAHLRAGSEPFRQRLLSALGPEQGESLVENLKSIAAAMTPAATRRGRAQRVLAPAAGSM